MDTAPLTSKAIDQVLITSNLARRVPRGCDPLKVDAALHKIAGKLNCRDEILKTLVQEALDFCAAGTAGLSVLRTGSEGPLPVMVRL